MENRECGPSDFALWGLSDCASDSAVCVGIPAGMQRATRTTKVHDRKSLALKTTPVLFGFFFIFGFVIVIIVVIFVERRRASRASSATFVWRIDSCDLQLDAYQSYSYKEWRISEGTIRAISRSSIKPSSVSIGSRS